VYPHVDLGKAHERSLCREVANGSLSRKAKEYTRLTILTKSLRESRRYRKLAEMYCALALREEPECLQPSKIIVKASPT
jgi:hypothetical protein